MRVSIRSLLVFGFGGGMLAAILVILWLGFYSAIQNTMSLLTDKAGSGIETLTDNLAWDLQDVEEQARWIADAYARGAIDPSDRKAFDSFLMGTQAATPEVAGTVWLRPDGRFLRVRRNLQTIDTGDWSDDPLVMEALERIQNADGPVWGEPIWIAPLKEAAINLRTPLRRDGEFKGMLVQVRTVSSLTEQLLSLSGHGPQVPFILYGDSHVLAHPALKNQSFEGNDSNPLPTIQQVGDPILGSIYESVPMELDLSAYPGADASFFDNRDSDREYIFLYKVVEGYANKPLTFGMHFDAELDNEEFERMERTFLGASIVLVLAVIGALVMAKITARPIINLANGANALRKGPIEEVPLMRPSFLKETNEAAKAFNGMVRGLKEKQKITDLFGRFVPKGVAEKMLGSPEGLAPQQTTATVLFCDIAGFTALAEKLGPEGTVALLNDYFTVMVDIIQSHNGIVTQFQGDAILAVFNVPLEDPNHAENAVISAREMQDALATRRFGGHQLGARVGVNTGPLVAGNVGAERRMNYTVHGDAVNTAARLEQLNKQYGTKILIAQATVDLLPDQSGLEQLGTAELRGKETGVAIYAMRESVPAK